MAKMSFKYKASVRFMSLAVLGLMLVSAVAIFAGYALYQGSPPDLEGILISSVPWLIVSAVGIWSHFDAARRYRDISISGEGLWVEAGGSRPTTLVPWDSVKSVEPFPLPGHPHYGRAKGGIRVLASDEPVLIYEKIQGFDQLCAEIQKHLAGRPIPVATR